MTDIKKRVENFKKEYSQISNKYRLDFITIPICKNRLLRFIIRLFGKSSKLSSMMSIEEFKDIKVMESKK